MRYDYDLTGERFGRLVVIKHAYVKKNQNWWECKCDCGNATIVKARRLSGKITKSCGCYRRERKSIEPYRWMYNLMVRCNNIRKRQKETMSFEEFKVFIGTSKCHYCGWDIVWNPHQFYKNRDLGSGGYYLDRKDNSLGYTKENCVVCCSLCNMVKGRSLTYDEMLIVGESIAEVQKNRHSRLTDHVSTMPEALTGNSLSLTPGVV